MPCGGAVPRTLPDHAGAAVARPGACAARQDRHAPGARASSSTCAPPARSASTATRPADPDGLPVAARRSGGLGGLPPRQEQSILVGQRLPVERGVANPFVALSPEARLARSRPWSRPSCPGHQDPIAQMSLVELLLLAVLLALAGLALLVWRSRPNQAGGGCGGPGPAIQANAWSANCVTSWRAPAPRAAHRAAGRPRPVPARASRPRALRPVRRKTSARPPDRRHPRTTAEMQQRVDQRLGQIQEDTEKKLEQMRATVDEKLHATLEQRLGELQAGGRPPGAGAQGPWRDAEPGARRRLAQPRAHNVKTRGILVRCNWPACWSRSSPQQYAANVATLPGSSERVEFAIALPGQRADGAPLWLPIDAKFPREVTSACSTPGARRHRRCGSCKARPSRPGCAWAHAACAKYIGPPPPTSASSSSPHRGLYAGPCAAGLVEGLQREHKVMVCGPTTLLATLTSLQMGFRTLALESAVPRSGKCWVPSRPSSASSARCWPRPRRELEGVQHHRRCRTRTRQMTRKLKASGPAGQGDAAPAPAGRQRGRRRIRRAPAPQRPAGAPG